MRIAIAGLLFLCSSSLPQQTTIRTTTQEVLLDVVVRDRSGRFVRDLKPGDLQVFEDGAPQNVRSFRLVDAGEQRRSEQEAAARQAASQAKTPASAPANNLRELRVVSIVFDSLTRPETRRYAQLAAREFLATELTSGVYVGLFALEERLFVLQPYTNDREQLLKQVDIIAAGSPSVFRRVSDPFERSLKTYAGKGGPSGSVLSNQAGAAYQLPGSAETFAMDTELMADLARTLEFDSRIIAPGQDRRRLFSLSALVREQGGLPGRKTVIFLSEGMRVPLDSGEFFRSAISEANRANVTFYTIDVRGLNRTETTFEGTNDLATAAAGSAMTTMPSNALGYERNVVYKGNNPAFSGVGLTDWRVVDRADIALTANSQAALRELAESTGGFLVADTNELRQPVHRIMDDVRMHYELSYTPANAILDGAFRKIEVKTPRSGLRVQSRSGYFAVPALPGQPVLPYEIPILTALHSDPPPHPFAFHAQVVPFRPGDNVQCSAVFEVPRRSLTLTPESSGWRTRVAFLALVRDERGHVVEKITRDLPLHVPGDKRAAFEAGNLIFTQAFQAPPGNYTVDAAILDGEGKRVTVQRSALSVPGPGGLRMSRIVPSRMLEETDEKRDPNDPFRFENKIVTPAISGVFRRSAGSDMMFFFTAYPDPSAREPVTLAIEFFKDGTPVSDSSGQLNVSVNDGSAPYLARFPAADFEPGRYEIVVTLKQGPDTATERTSFTLEP